MAVKMLKPTRDIVLRRDSYRCFICGKSLIGVPCAVHHRKYRSHDQSLINSPANLISVCGQSNVDECHGKCHNHDSINPYIFGWSVSGIGTTSLADPHLVPVLRFDGCWYLLDDDGKMNFAGRASDFDDAQTYAINNPIPDF